MFQSLLKGFKKNLIRQVTQGRVPVHLLEQFIHVALFGHQNGTFAKGNRLEELHSQTSGAHLSSQPHPALAIIFHLQGHDNVFHDMIKKGFSKQIAILYKYDIVFLYSIIILWWFTGA